MATRVLTLRNDIRRHSLLPSALAITLLLSAFHAAAQDEVAEIRDLKQTELGFYFVSIRFVNNKALFKLHESGTRYLVRDIEHNTDDPGRITEYGEILTLAPGQSLDLVEKHSELKLISRKGQPNPTIEIESSFNADDMGGLPTTKKMTLVRSSLNGLDITLLSEGTKTIALRPPDPAIDSH